MKTILFKNGAELKVSQKVANIIASHLNLGYTVTKIWSENESLDYLFILSEIVAIY